MRIAELPTGFLNRDLIAARGSNVKPKGTLVSIMEELPGARLRVLYLDGSYRGAIIQARYVDRSPETPSTPTAE
jgi:hypothetical protein